MPEVLEEAKEQEIPAGAEESTDTSEAVKTADPLEGRVDLQKALYLLAQTAYGWDKAERRAEVLDVRQQRFYWRGIQYLYWNDVSGCYVSPQGGLTQMSIGSTTIDMPKYTQTFNIYTPYGRGLIAAFTQNQPGVRFKAEDPKDGDDIKAKSESERYRHYFDVANDNKKLQQDISRFYYTDGRTTSWTYFDEQQSREVAESFGVLETKCPARAASLKKCPYFFISREVELVDAKEEHSKYADKLKPGPSGLGDEYERTARLGVISSGSGGGEGDSGNHLTTEHYIWFRPSMFREAGKKKSTEATSEKTQSEELRGIFPNGCRVCFVGEIYCGSEKESMDDCLAVSFPLPGDGMNRPSMGRDLIPFQDTTNDSVNLWKETYDYQIPVTYMNCGVNDIAALRAQWSEPGNHIPFKKKDGEPMEDNFHTESPATVSGDFMKFVEDIRGQFAQFVSGALPSLYGGSMPDQKTASGYAMAREQAMGQMGLPWGSMQRHFARIYEQAAALAAKHRGTGKVNVEMPSGKQGKKDQTKIEELNFGNMKGKVLCFPDVDSSFPETYSAKKQAFFQFLSLAGAEALKFINTPNNLEVTRDMIGLEDLEIDGAESCDKQRRELEKLLNEAPVPDTQAFEKALMAWQVQTAAAAATAQTQGQPAQPPAPEPKQTDFLKTSVPIDEKMEKGRHHYHFEELQRFFESIEGEEAERENPKGWLNARLHALDHEKVAEAEADAQQEKKPPSQSINFKDLPAEGQIQMAAEAGLKLNPPQPQAQGAAA